ncbi:PH domain-containing protein [Corynebacterium sp.]|uniref:PH domain-containing protein n=1 Tax=Corynebacterium sp. TaxID=1720 RepID=UPI0026DD1DC6|nr:PH domain-containing protein [Corynebacterium sp.]MDO5077125.1 PH domain-containing protein [Corynebacterium sp.]
MKQYQRVHRLTPLLKFWQFILAAIAVAVVNLNQELLRDIRDLLNEVTTIPSWLGALVIFAGFAIACGLVWAISGVWWRAYGYRLDGEEISVKSGVLNTKLRTARYDRIQAVDVVENVISRIFGVAAVRVETAGGKHSVLNIAFLRRAMAEELREEILDLRSGTPTEVGAELGDEPPREPAGEVVIPPIPVSRSLIAAALASLWFGGTAPIGAVFGGPGILLPMLLAALPAVWSVTDRSWNFTATLDRDVFHVSYGLADKRKQSIPLQRIHAVRIRQPVLWRLCDWWIVEVSIAGYALGDKKAGTTRLLPVGTRDQAMHLASVITPLSAAELEAYAPPEGFVAPDFRSPLRARWVSPIDFSQQATTLFDHAVIIHEGRWQRRVTIIHPSHIQELTWRRGPIQRLAHVDTIRLDLVDGPARMSARDLAPDDAQRLLATLRGRELPSAIQH